MSVPTGGDATPSAADVQATYVATLVDEWVRAGVRHAVICPGSRSTPLALALALDGRLELHVRLDERSAGFVGLGIGLATGRPAVICVTSGTAAAELHPAAVEAHHARVPLLLCTADRPPELHHVGAPQTIDQSGLYGSTLRWQVDLGVADWSGRHAWRSVGARAVAEATAGPYGPGPVQVNLPAREPLVGSPAPLHRGRPDAAPWHRVEDGTGPEEDPGTGSAGTPPGVADIGPGRAGRRGVIVAGAGAGDPHAVLALSDALGWPVLADARSGCRVRHDGVVAAAGALLRVDDFAESRPDVIIRLGDPWVSKTVAAWLDRTAADGATQVLVDPHWSWPDPGRHVDVVVRARPTGWCRSMADVAVSAGPPGTTEWRSGWAAGEARAQAAIDSWCQRRRELTEPGLARAVTRAVAAGGGGGVGAAPENAGSVSLFVSSSMPVRDVECYGPVTETAPPVFANRGASGIDGVVSSAMGVALASGPTVALVGDLAFLHDLTALVRPAGPEANCVVVVVDNGGGGIFSFLPTAAAVDAELFERLFATPQTVNVASAARGLGAVVEEVDDRDGATRAVERGLTRSGVSVVRAVVGDHHRNVELHEELNAAVVSAVGRGPTAG